MQKSGMFGILEYSEPFHNCVLFVRHIQNPVIFLKIGKLCITQRIQNLTYSQTWSIRTLANLTPYTYAVTSQKFKMQCFLKINKSYGYFSKALLDL